MQLSEDNIRIIFGLKLKQLRSENNLSLSELSKKCGLSVSYLNEIEKGKKYPKAEKIIAISSALNTTYDKLVSLKLTKNLAPLTQILNSPIIKELPLELFGIESNKLIEIIANAPAKVNAFISTLIELARNYDLSTEQFYFAAMRSYQESHENYFEDLENTAQSYFKSQPSFQQNINSEYLKNILIKEYNYTINDSRLSNVSSLKQLRAVFLPDQKLLLINSLLNESQKTFLFAKEIGYNYLKLTDRPYTSRMLKADNFEQVLSNFKASYFAGALIINRDLLIKDIKKFIVRPDWNGREFLAIMNKYTESPETFMHRLTNILPRFFGLSNLFFLRFINNQNTSYFSLTSELHLAQLHNPHQSGLDEHYCRRWVSLNVLNELAEKRKKTNNLSPIIGAQISRYIDSDNEYFVIAVARPLVRTGETNCSVSLGFLLNNDLKKRLNFWNDSSVISQTVGETCERCSMTDCSERAYRPKVYDKIQRIKDRYKAVEVLKTELISNHVNVIAPGIV